jgi:hypothetical protein
MFKWLNDIFTGIDGKTSDPARVLWILGVVVFLCFAGYGIYKEGKFDMQQFAIAYGALLVSGAAGVKVKSSTEPEQK